MRIEAAALARPQIKSTAPTSSGPAFRDVLQNALRHVNELQLQSDVAYHKLITGEIEFHDAMVIAEQANLALQLTMAIRSKIIEAYQEIMRMQV
ncbi:MAG: flagellar hook-basal body complex protein FliE [Firmicutes bacterium]|jgi:flagellar hook-basal body complex protein FliE|nr:flagellar hook-basal body complex protein FliE [Bacillota bacterium]